MKNIKHLLFLSILCSLVLFTNCGEDEDPVADDPTNNTNDGSITVLDADGDGVADADDTCADTAEGATVNTSGCPVVAESLIYLDENGITIKVSEDAVVGESSDLDSISYLVVDSAMLSQMVANEEDVTKVVMSRVSNMTAMFKDAYSFNQDISSWDVSSITNMGSMFYRTPFFNQDLSSWDVSNVTNMSEMFNGYNEVNEIPQSSFNGDISSWDVSNVMDMRFMFSGAISFNQDIGSWDVSNVTDIYGMFDGAYAFNQDISYWDVSEVTNCLQLSYEATAWTEPKPNFTNCTE